MTGTAVQSSDIAASARLIGLLRLLHLAIAIAVLSFWVGSGDAEIWKHALRQLQSLLLWTAVASAVLIVAVPLVRSIWQLVLHLVFDLLWVGYMIYLSGGVSSPGVSLLFAVVLTGTLVLPGVAPFLVPSIAALVLASSASFYLAGIFPFDRALLSEEDPILHAPRTLGNLAVQVGAIFLVDLLGQILSRRVHEQRVMTGELLDQLDEGVLAVDRLGRVIYANDALARLLQVEPILAGNAAVEAFAGPEHEAVRETLSSVRLPAWGRMDLGGRHLVLRAGVLLGRAGREIGRTLLIADESRLRDLEEDAARAERLAALGEMAAGIAHEIRNPLSSLRGCAQELAGMPGAQGDDDAAMLARIMLQEADRLERIVDDFLQLSRMRSPECSALPLPPILAELRELASRRQDLPEGVRVDVSCADGCPAAWADAGQLRQVLVNLVNNAIEAIARGGGSRVAVRAEPAAGADAVRAMLRLLVEDDGPGIPPERIEQVFTPFFSTRSKGTGLGLTLVQRIVEQHGGSVRIASELGRGTQVIVLWPAAQRSAGVVAAERAAGLSAG